MTRAVKTLGKHARSVELQIPAYEKCAKGRWILQDCRKVDGHYSRGCGNYMRQSRRIECGERDEEFETMVCHTLWACQ